MREFEEFVEFVKECASRYASFFLLVADVPDDPTDRYDAFFLLADRLYCYLLSGDFEVWKRAVDEVLKELGYRGQTSYLIDPEHLAHIAVRHLPWERLVKLIKRLRPPSPRVFETAIRELAQC